MLKIVWDLIKGAWGQGRRLLVALIVLATAIVALELGQSHLLGESVHRITAQIAPWQPIFSSRASLDGDFYLRKVGDAEAVVVQSPDLPCPVGSKVSLSYKRSRAGWVLAIGLTEPFVGNDDWSGAYALSSEGLEPVYVQGGQSYEASFEITSADGLELLAIVGADKPFKAEKHIIPQLRRLDGSVSKGGSADLAKYNLRWTDAPILRTCISN